MARRIVLSNKWVSENSLEYLATGETKTISLQLTGPWAMEKPDWITSSIENGLGGYYSAITLTASENFATEIRSGNVFFIPLNERPVLAVSVAQDRTAISEGLSIRLTDNELEIPAAGGSINIEDYSDRIRVFYIKDGVETPLTSDDYVISYPDGTTYSANSLGTTLTDRTLKGTLNVQAVYTGETMELTASTPFEIYQEENRVVSATSSTTIGEYKEYDYAETEGSKTRDNYALNFTPTPDYTGLNFAPASGTVVNVSGNATCVETTTINRTGYTSAETITINTSAYTSTQSANTTVYGESLSSTTSAYTRTETVPVGINIFTFSSGVILSTERIESADTKEFDVTVKSKGTEESSANAHIIYVSPIGVSDENIDFTIQQEANDCSTGETVESGIYSSETITETNNTDYSVNVIAVPYSGSTDKYPASGATGTISGNASHISTIVGSAITYYSGTTYPYSAYTSGEEITGTPITWGLDGSSATTESLTPSSSTVNDGVRLSIVYHDTDYNSNGYFYIEGDTEDESYGGMESRIRPSGITLSEGSSILFGFDNRGTVIGDSQYVTVTADNSQQSVLVPITFGLYQEANNEENVEIISAVTNTWTSTGTTTRNENYGISAVRTPDLNTYPASGCNGSVSATAWHDETVTTATTPYSAVSYSSITTYTSNAYAKAGIPESGKTVGGETTYEDGTTTRVNDNVIVDLEGGNRLFTIANITGGTTTMTPNNSATTFTFDNRGGNTGSNYTVGVHFRNEGNPYDTQRYFDFSQQANERTLSNIQLSFNPASAAASGTESVVTLSLDYAYTSNANGTASTQYFDDIKASPAENITIHRADGSEEGEDASRIKVEENILATPRTWTISGITNGGALGIDEDDSNVISAVSTYVQAAGEGVYITMDNVEIYNGTSGLTKIERVSANTPWTAVITSGDQATDAIVFSASRLNGFVGVTDIIFTANDYNSGNTAITNYIEFTSTLDSAYTTSATLTHGNNFDFNIESGYVPEDVIYIIVESSKTINDLVPAYFTEETSTDYGAMNEDAFANGNDLNYRSVDDQMLSDDCVLGTSYKVAKRVVSGSTITYYLSEYPFVYKYENLNLNITNWQAKEIEGEETDTGGTVAPEDNPDDGSEDGPEEA